MTTNANRTVLLVDDDKNLLMGLVRALRDQPFEIFTAQNGDDAIWMMKTREIDVIVADERMPGLSGCELMAWVAANCPDVMRIVLTGHGKMETAIRAINETDVYRFFTKPCNETRLALAIHDAIEEKDSRERSRRMLEENQRRLRDLELRSQDVEFQTRIVSQDLLRPLQLILDCCRRLEEQTEGKLDRQSRELLSDARRAADKSRQLVARLQNISTHSEQPAAN
ncbi:MAG: response regulator [Pirellulales bacterium]|nr:response regulator [Pirellulales bacterium]